MASKNAADGSSTDSALECVVCLLTFDLDQRLPKSLKCGHTICQSCLTQLTKQSAVSCPTCRQDSRLQSDVTTNYALKDILEKQCPSCQQQKPLDQCPHCPSRLCSDCRQDHVRAYTEDVNTRVKTLCSVAKIAQDLSFDPKFEEEQRQKKQQEKQHLLQELDDIERRNLDKLRGWSTELMGKSSDAVSFATSTRNTLRTATTDVSDIKKIDDQCETLLGELRNLTSGPPPITSYRSKRVPGQQPTGLDTIDGTSAAKSPRPPTDRSTKPKRLAEEASDLTTTVQSSSLPAAAPRAPPPKTPAPQPQTSPEDVTAVAKLPPPLPCKPDKSSVYTQMRFQRMVGSEGSEREQFDEPIDVVCTNNAIFVSDHNNHRIKQFDHDLNLVSTFGGPQRFNYPSGMVVGRKGELFICDMMNNRVKVTDMKGNTIRKFGTHGTGSSEFSQPIGIAQGINGELYVCDTTLNARVQVVSEFGAHVRMIGSKGTTDGQFKTYPTYIVITKQQRLLVIEYNCSKLKQFSLTGTFLGLWPPSVPEVKDIAVSALCVNPADGHVIVAYTNGQIAVYTEGGDFVYAFGDKGDGPGEFYGVLGLALTKHQDLIVCDTWNHRIQKFSFK